MSDVFLSDPITGRRCGVSGDSRLRASATINPTRNVAAVRGQTFDVSTDVLTLTDATEAPVLYVKNTHPELYLRLDTFAWSYGPANGATHQTVITRVYDASTAAVGGMSQDVLRHNRLFGSRQQPSIVAKKGGTGIGFSDGTLLTPLLQQSAASHLVTSGLPLQPQAGVLVTVQPPSGNIAMWTVVYLITEFFDPTVW